MNRILIYVQNHQEAYQMREQLTKQVAKRLEKCQPVDSEYLANCSTMQKITFVGVKICRKYNEPWSKEERQDAVRAMAEIIISDAEYINAHK